MKILFDEDIFTKHKYGGITRYFSELMAGMKRKNYLANKKRIYTKNVHYNDKIESLITDKYIPKIAQNRLIHTLNLLGNRRFKNVEKLKKYDLLHLTYYNYKILEDVSKPIVSTIHDCIHEVYLNDLTQTIPVDVASKHKVLLKSDRIVSVSNSTKNELIKLLPNIDPNIVKVIYLGVTIPKNCWNNISIDLPKNYILFVGNRKYYKNFYWLLKILKPFLTKSSYTLLCAGGGTFDYYDLEYIKRLNLTNNVKQISFLNDEELYAIYSRAHCFIFPSLFEGFGIPTLEAMSAGCPVILNDIPVFREVAGDAALYFKPEYGEQLLNNINELHKKEVREEIIERGYQQSKKYSWENCINEHIELYKELINL